ncbi:39S ribosomal protein L45 [Leeia sp. TBRC 13508]|uniref:39S ribosomal protein L45 n=1 Tax=Leeia speluncae TaxID=2884804 RepID=A0ABS8D9P6_9NEIS|nr:Tim44-like domain-containing protein [Leeia speluncae]MCB6184847.1 39S ribosomal protein L45 [Leeia speluncae]
MKFLSMLAIVLTLGFAFVSQDAEAKRLGSGRSSGMQRNIDAPSKPMQSPMANNAARPGAAAAAQPQKRSWLGPIAGLAAGLGLAALASHFGFGEEMASIMMMVLIGFAIMMVIGFFMRRKAASQQPAMAGMGGNYAQNQYRNQQATFDQSAQPYGSTASNSFTPSVPAGFDTDGFVRSAKVHFIRLQAANDAGNLDDIREFTTPEMFAEIKMDIADRKGAAQTTDVLNIEAEILEVIQENNRQVASVRFTGLVREDKNAAADPIDEVWHLVRASNGNSGWLLAGIQQTN